MLLWEEGSLASTLTHTPNLLGWLQYARGWCRWGKYPMQRPLKCLKEVRSETTFPQVISGMDLSMLQLLCANRREPLATLSTTQAHSEL